MTVLLLSYLWHITLINSFLNSSSLDYFGRGGDVGTVLIWSLVLTTMTTQVFQRFGSLELCMGAADRLMKYKNLETEPEEEQNSDAVDEEWPKRGEVEFQDVMAKHEGGKYVLKSVSFTAQDGEKVDLAMLTQIKVFFFFFFFLHLPLFSDRNCRQVGCWQVDLTERSFSLDKFRRKCAP